MRQLLPSNSLLGQWMFEIGSIALASAAVAAMVTLLINFDGERIFDGPMITLNAVISTLSTTSRVCLLAMLASTISQWNWLLFSNKPRRLVDFEYFSAASRGPLGSLKVLLDFRILGGPIVRVGAFVTILTIALDPFAQQLVQLEKKIQVEETRESQASIPTADDYSRGVVRIPQGTKGTFTVEDGRLVPSDENMLASVEPDSGMDISIKLSYADVDPGLRHHVAYNCTTADCEFDSFNSLAVCSQCEDLSASLKRRVVRRKRLLVAELVEDQKSPNETKECTEYFLPNGLYLSNINGDDDIYSPYQLLRMVMFGTGDSNRTLAMKKVNTLIWAQSLIYVDAASMKTGFFEWPKPKVHAQECALYYCVKRYSAAVKNGTLVENSTVLEDHRRIQDSWQIYSNSKNLKAKDLPEYARNSLAWDPAIGAFMRDPLLLGVPGSERRWSIASDSVYSISALMKQTFTKCMEERDNCTEESSRIPPTGFIARREFAPLIAEKLQYDPESLFERMARGMSTAIRNGADEGQHVSGTTLIPIPVYKVAWPWIILHLLATIGSLIFLVATIWSTHKAKLPAWKSSELAVFSQVAAANGVFDGRETYYELEEKAKNVPVVLLEKRDRDDHIMLEDLAASGDVSEEEMTLTRPMATPKAGSLFRRGRNRGEYGDVRVND